MTKDVPAFAIIKGNPGRIAGWVNEDGEAVDQAPTNKLEEK